MADQIPLEILIQIRDELAGLSRTRAGLQESKTAAEGLGAALKQGLGIGSGIALATGAVALFKNTIQQTAGEAFRFAGEVQDMSTALGLSASTYQVLRLEFKAAGLDIGRLNQAVGEQTRSLAEARVVTSAAAQAYSDLGLSAAEIERLPIDERLIAVARAALAAKDQTAAFAAAADILGSRNLPLLLSALQKLGTEGTAALTAAYDAQGLILGDPALARLDKAEKSWAKLWHTIVVGSGEFIGKAAEYGEAAKRIALPLAASMSWMPKSLSQRGQHLDSAWGEFIKEPGAAPKAVPGDPKLIAEAQALAAARLQAAEATKVLAKAAADAQAALMQAGQATRESVLTPYEKYDAAIAALRAQLTGGAIDQATYARATDQARSALQEITTAIDPATEALRRQGEAIHDSVMTPLERYAEKVVELDALNRAGAITGEDYARALKAAYVALADGGGETVKLVAASVNTASLQISDAIVGLQTWGQAFRNLGQIALDTLSQVITKMLVVAALKAVLNFASAGIGGAVGKFLGAVSGKLGGGGTFVTDGPANITVGDNPGGREIVSVLPISGVGQTVFNGNTMAMAGGGTLITGGRSMGGGDTFHFAYSFHGGVSRQEVMGLIPSIVEASKGAVLEAKRRRRDGF